MEELEAIDRYQQRADSCAGPRLKNALPRNEKKTIKRMTTLVEMDAP